MSYATGSPIPMAVEAGVFGPGESVVWELREYDSGIVYATGAMTEVVIGSESQYSATTGAIADAGAYLGRAYVVGAADDWVPLGEVSVGIEADALNHDRLAEQVPGEEPVVAAPAPVAGSVWYYVDCYGNGELQNGVEVQLQVIAVAAGFTGNAYAGATYKAVSGEAPAGGSSVTGRAWIKAPLAKGAEHIRFKFWRTDKNADSKEFWGVTTNDVPYPLPDVFGPNRTDWTV